jgi:NADPH-dependent curcumin reductase CurA
MSTPVSTQIQLAARPQGWPTHDDFRTVRVPLGALEAGHVRVRNEFVSVDPYMGGADERRPQLCRPVPAR